MERRLERGGVCLVGGRRVKGLQIVGNFYECGKVERLVSEEECRRDISYMIRNCGLKEVGYRSNIFEGGGFTSVWLLEESHLSVHTWPEDRAVDFDVYVCNYKSDNTRKGYKIYDFVRDFFSPGEEFSERIWR